MSGELSGPQEHRLPVTRTARVFTLGAAHAADVWIVLHGYAHLAARFIGQFAHLAGAARRIVAPEALNRFYLDPPRLSVPAADRRVGTTWMTREDRAAEIADYVSYLDAVAREFAGPHIPVTILGFSQGVATATRWAALGSVSVARLVLWAGTLPPDLDSTRLAGRLAGARVDLVIGARDEVLDAAEVARSEKVLRDAGIAHSRIRFAGGHTLDRDLLAQLARDVPGGADA
ncbi:MAG: alpha/beta hydrolase [Gemmatimonadaceae bacterium]